LQFETEIIGRSDTAVIRCNGRFVYGNGVARLRDSAVKLLSESRHCVLNFDRVTQIDAWGLGVLAELHRMACDGAGSVMLASVKPPVRELLDLTGLQGTLRVYDSEEAAVAARRRVA